MRLGITQLAKLTASVARRQAIAKQYDDAFDRWLVCIR